MIVDIVSAGAVELRPWTEADAQWYVDARDELVFRYTTELRGLTAAQVIAAIHRVTAHEREAAWAIWTADGRLVGNMALALEPRGHEAELSYFLSAEGRGKGFAGAAATAACAWAFGHLGIDHVTARVSVTNKPSIKVLQRAGFVRTGEGYHQTLGPISYWSLARPGGQPPT